MTAKGSTAYGWAQRFTVADTGDARLTHRSPAWYTLLLGAQVLLWLADRLGAADLAPPRGPAIDPDQRACRRPGGGPVMKSRWPAVVAIRH